MQMDCMINKRYDMYQFLNEHFQKQFFENIDNDQRHFSKVDKRALDIANKLLRSLEDDHMEIALLIKVDLS